MNIYSREMKAHLIGLVWWCIGMAALVSSGMAKFAAYEAAGQSIQQILAGLPKTMLVIFGMTGFDLTTGIGFYGVLYLYIAVMAAVHATLLGSHVVSEEERDRTSEFLFAKPVSRSAALTAKLLAGLTNLVIFNVATLLSSFYFVDFFSKGEPSYNADILIMMAGLFFMQLIFFAVGTVVAGTVRKPKLAPSIATSVMFLTFLLSYLVNLNDKLDALKYVTPFKYFDAAVLITDGRLDPVYVALSAALIVLGVAGTYWFFGARDLNV